MSIEYPQNYIPLNIFNIKVLFFIMNKSVRKKLTIKIIQEIITKLHYVPYQRTQRTPERIYRNNGGRPKNPKNRNEFL